MADGIVHLSTASFDETVGSADKPVLVAEWLTRILTG